MPTMTDPEATFGAAKELFESAYNQEDNVNYKYTYWVGDEEIEDVEPFMLKQLSEIGHDPDVPIKVYIYKDDGKEAISKDPEDEFIKKIPTMKEAQTMR